MVTQPTVRIALVGLGLWGRMAYLPVLRRADGVTVVAAMDPLAGDAGLAAATAGIPLVTSRIDELWDHAADFDAVIIATPTDTHNDIARQALALGKHVLCEKPLAFDLPQARALAAAAGRAGVVTRMGFIFRHAPAMMRMRELIRSGYVGDVVAFQSHTMNAQFVDPLRPLHWKMRRERANGGVHVEYGAHAIELALDLAGPIRRVVADAMTITPARSDEHGAMTPVDVDDAASWLVEFASGARGSFQTSWSTLPIGGGGVRVYGTQGALAWEQDVTLRERETLTGATVADPAPRVLLACDSAWLPLDPTEQPRLGLSLDYTERLVAAFLDDIRTGRRTGPDFTTGLRVQAVLAAIGTSLGSGRWEPIEQDEG